MPNSGAGTSSGGCSPRARVGSRWTWEAVVSSHATAFATRSTPSRASTWSGGAPTARPSAGSGRCPSFGSRANKTVYKTTTSATTKKVSIANSGVCSRAGPFEERGHRRALRLRAPRARRPRTHHAPARALHPWLSLCFGIRNAAAFRLPDRDGASVRRLTRTVTTGSRLDHFAHFHHAELGYTFDRAWTPRLVSPVRLCERQRRPRRRRQRPFRHPLRGAAFRFRADQHLRRVCACQHQHARPAAPGEAHEAPLQLRRAARLLARRTRRRVDHRGNRRPGWQLEQIHRDPVGDADPLSAPPRKCDARGGVRPSLRGGVRRGRRLR